MNAGRSARPSWSTRGARRACLSARRSTSRRNPTGVERSQGFGFPWRTRTRRLVARLVLPTSHGACHGATENGFAPLIDFARRVRRCGGMVRASRSGAGSALVFCHGVAPAAARTLHCPAEGRVSAARCAARWGERSKGPRVRDDRRLAQSRRRAERRGTLARRNKLSDADNGPVGEARRGHAERECGGPRANARTSRPNKSLLGEKGEARGGSGGGARARA